MGKWSEGDVMRAGYLITHADNTHTFIPATGGGSDEGNVGDVVGNLAAGNGSVATADRKEPVVTTGATRNRSRNRRSVEVPVEQVNGTDTPDTTATTPATTPTPDVDMEWELLVAQQRAEAARQQAERAAAQEARAARVSERSSVPTLADLVGPREDGSVKMVENIIIADRTVATRQDGQKYVDVIVARCKGVTFKLRPGGSYAAKSLLPRLFAEPFAPFAVTVEYVAQPVRGGKPYVKATIAK